MSVNLGLTLREIEDRGDSVADWLSAAFSAVHPERKVEIDWVCNSGDVRYLIGILWDERPMADYFFGDTTILEIVTMSNWRHYE